MPKPILSLIFVTFLASPAGAAQPYLLESRGGPGVLSGAERWRIGYLGDNDSIGMATDPGTGDGFDRWYSTGTQLQLRRAVDRAELPLVPREAKALASASLAQNIYTPRNARIVHVSELQGDRPYSGWMALSLGAELLLPRAPLSLVSGATPYSHLGVDLHLGGIGPWTLSGPTQHYAHETWRVFAGQQIPPIVGWGEAETATQIGADLAAFAETSVISLGLSAPSWMTWSGAAPQLYWLAGARLDAGTTLTAAALSSTLALGWMGDPLARELSFFPLTLYVYARAEGRAVVRNATIDGPLLDGRVVARSEPLVADFSAGAVARVYGLEVSWVHAYRTNETATLPEHKRHGQLLWHWSAAWLF